MNVAFKTQLHNPSRPDGMPTAWPWGAVVELGESVTAPDQSGEWQVMTLEQFEAYKVLHRPAYDAHVAVIQAAEIAYREAQIILEAKRKKGAEIIQRMEDENYAEGINLVQAMHLTETLRYQAVPAGTTLLDGSVTDREYQVNVLTFLRNGWLEMAYSAATFIQPDAMNQPHHWISQARKDKYVGQILQGIQELQ